MKYEVRYLSKTGNTKKNADEIAKLLKIEALTIETPVSNDTDILFLGGAPYGFQIDANLKEYINNITNKNIKVALFSTSAFFKMAEKNMRKLLIKNDIEVLPDSFYTKGEYGKANIGKPDKDDLIKVKEFVDKIKEYK